VSKVFVGNLSFDTTREQLEEFFSPFGEITDISVPTDRDSGRPRGFAFVTFATPEAAAQAIQRCDGAELGGRNLRVNEATERSERPMGRGFGAPSSRPGPPSRPKGSRRNVRGRKRSIW
jgi:cold-inducible RNA-binding protein